MKYCKAVEELTKDELNHIIHMVINPSVFQQTVHRINEEFDSVRFPEDIKIVIGEGSK